MLFSKLWFVRFFSEYSNSPHRSPNTPGFERFTKNFVASSIRPTTGNTIVKASAIYAPNRNTLNATRKISTPAVGGAQPAAKMHLQKVLVSSYQLPRGDLILTIQMFILKI
jgi:hypothetical protein